MIITGKLDAEGKAIHQNVPEKPTVAEYEERIPLTEKPWAPLEQMLATAAGKFA